MDGIGFNPGDLGAHLGHLRTLALQQQPGGQAAECPAEVARRFETILVHQLMSAMRDSIGEGGLLDDATGKQLQDIFWTHMADVIGEQGGLGLWKQLQHHIAQAGNLQAPPTTGTEVELLQ